MAFPGFTLYYRMRPLRLSIPALLVTSTWCLGDGPASAQKPDRITPPPRELLETHCFDCHGDGAKKGDFSLEKLLEGGATDENEAAWQKAWKIVRHGFMPPADADPMPEADRKQVTQWIEQQKLGVDYAKPDPGRVTMRRLNRMEYEFTVSDLFGVDLVAEADASSDGAARARLRDMLPPDDTAFGFDNIGDFQTLSPALLEKYFNIAEFVVDRVVVQDGPPLPERHLSARDLAIDRADQAKRVDHAIGFGIEQAGEYRIELQFSLGGWQDYGGGYDFSLRVDEQDLAKDFVENGGQKTYRPAGVVTLKPGEHRLTFATVGTKPSSTGAYSLLELRPRIRLIGPLDSRGEYPEPHRRIFFRGAAPEERTARRAYAREILQRIADRAYRRPTPAAMLDRLTDLALTNPQFERGIAQALVAVLTSPKFLYRAELQPQPDDPKAIHPIDEYALASRLSYLLWLSLPDDELRGLAERGELRKNVSAQLRRMLADPKAGRFFEDFPGQWLRTRNVLMTPVSRRDQAVDPVRGAMKRETEMLFEHIAREDKDLLELVTADYTFLDPGLARFYGVAAVEGDGFRKVTLPADSHRGGLLSQGTFLFSTSNPGRTSPVKRGLFVLENLLAVEVPPPPPSIPALEDAKTNGRTPQTIREQLEAHRADKSCAACHAHFDPIGLALENFDAISRWRDTERGEPIKPSEVTTTGQKLTGVGDLKKLFVDRKEQFYHSITQKLLTYALGRGLEPSDAVTVDRITTELLANGGRFSTLLAAIVASPPFQTRRGDDGSLKIAPRVAIPATPPPELRKGRRFGPRPNAEAPLKTQDSETNPKPNSPN